jgi:predicted RNA-binding protein with PUA-like domain
MAGFLVKTEPSTYAWDDLVRDGETVWDGVRNFEARNNLRAMKKGDPVLFYHSGGEKAVVGLARVARAAYPEPGAAGAEWLAVDLVPVKSLARRVSLAAIKAEPALAGFSLVKRPRLSVVRVEKAELERVLALGATRL